MKLFCNLCKNTIEVDESSIERVRCLICLEKNREVARERWRKNPKKSKNVKNPLNERLKEEKELGDGK